MKGVNILANTSSAKKRIKVIAKKQLRNKSIRSYTKTTVKKLSTAIESGDKAKVEEAHKLAVRAIDKAASKGIFHKNTASRKKSKLAKLVNS